MIARTSLFIVSASFLCACAGTGGLDSTHADADHAALDSAQGVAIADVNLRSGPGVSNQLLGTIPSGTTVTISCQASGDDIDGDSAWDYLPDYGGYVSDQYLSTGYDDFIPDLPRCADSGGGTGGAPPTSGTGGSPPVVDGDLGAAIVTEARSFAGYHEIDENYCNEFSTWLGRPCEQWCADYAQYVWQQAGADTGGLNAGAISFYDYGIAHGTWKDGQDAANVQPGDAVVWAASTTSANHVGLVTAVNGDGTITTINGDFFDDGDLSRVSELTTARSNQVGTGANILGYASPVR